MFMSFGCFVGESVPVSEQSSLKALRRETRTVSESTAGSLTADERQQLHAQLDDKVG